MIQKKNLRSYFPGFLENGAIFYEMTLLEAPWTPEVGKDMDNIYLSMYSGIKQPSEFVDLNSVDGNLDIPAVSRLLWSMYGFSWKHLWNAYNLEYNPIDNYNVNETVTRGQDDTRTIARTEDVIGTSSGSSNEIGVIEESGTLNGTSIVKVSGGIKEVGTENGNSTNTVQHGHQLKTDGEIDSFTHAFNSASKVPTSVQIDTQTQVNSGEDITTNVNKADTTKDTTTNNSTNTTDNNTTSGKTDTTIDTTTSSNTTDKTTENTSDTTKINESITRNRKGNVGQNSYQELLQQEFNLWKWNFYKQVFEDVDKFLVLSVYDPCSSVN